MEKVYYGNIFNEICKTYNLTYKSIIIEYKNIIYFMADSKIIYQFNIDLLNIENMNEVYDNILTLLLNRLNFKI